MSGLILPENVRDSWRHRAVEATEGNQSLLGCFVLAILGWQHNRKPPRFGSIARIDAEGNIITHMQAADGRMFRDHCLGPVQEVIDNFRGLADHLKLDDIDRAAMFAELRKWFAHDARADATPEERELTK